MKFVHIFWVIIGTLIFLMIGCFLLFGVFLGICSIEDVIKEIQNLYTHRFFAGLFGIFFIWGGYEAVKTLMKRSARDEIFVAETESGKTSVSIFAVEDLIKKTLKKNETIKRFHVKVRVRDKSLIIPVDLTLWAEHESSDVVRDVQQLITKKIVNFVGIKSDLLKLDVKVAKVVERKQKAE